MTYDANRAIAYAPSPPRSVCLRLIVTPNSDDEREQKKKKQKGWFLKMTHVVSFLAVIIISNWAQQFYDKNSAPQRW